MRTEKPVPSFEEQIQDGLRKIKRAQELADKYDFVMKWRFSVNTELYRHLCAMGSPPLDMANVEHEPRLLPGRNLMHVSAEPKKDSLT